LWREVIITNINTSVHHEPATLVIMNLQKAFDTVQVQARSQKPQAELSPLFISFLIDGPTRALFSLCHTEAALDLMLTLNIFLGETGRITKDLVHLFQTQSFGFRDLTIGKKSD